MVEKFTFGKVYKDGATSYRVNRRNEDGTLEFRVDDGYTNKRIQRSVSVCRHTQSERFWPCGDSKPVYAKA
jgi:hypothetical protein